MSLVFLKKENGKIIGYGDKLSSCGGIAYQNNSTKIKLFPNSDKSKNVIVCGTGTAFELRMVFIHLEEFFDVNLTNGDIEHDIPIIIDSFSRLYKSIFTEEKRDKYHELINISVSLSIGDKLYAVAIDNDYDKYIRVDTYANFIFCGYGKDIMQGFVRANVPIDKAFEVIHEMYPSYVSKEFDVVEYEYE